MYDEIVYIEPYSSLDTHLLLLSLKLDNYFESFLILTRGRIERTKSWHQDFNYKLQPGGKLVTLGDENLSHAESKEPTKTESSG